VTSPVSFDKMIAVASEADVPLFCYEGDGTEKLKAFLSPNLTRLKEGERPTVSIVIGPEGGFSPEEAAKAKAAGMMPIGLGNRILRTETVSSFVLGALVYEFELG